MTTPSSILMLATALALGTVAVTAEAEPSAPARDPAAAEALFRAAIGALDRGDWDGACPKFNASMSLDPAVSTLLNVAKCHDHEGKLATAWAELNRALVLNGETAGAQRKAALEKYTKGLIAALEPRVPKLSIVVRDRPDGLRITRDGVDVSAAALGEALPVDPGAYVIEGSAPGYESDKRAVDVAEGKAATIELVLVATPPPRGEVPPVVVPPSAPTPLPDRGPRGWRGGAFAAGGIGIAGALVGAVTGGLMLAKKDVVEGDCTSASGGVSLCRTAGGVDAGNSAKTLGLVSSVGWVTTLAGLGVGTALLLTEPRSAKAAQSGRRVSVGLVGPSPTFVVEGGF